jgi:hypothetical protein
MGLDRDLAALSRLTFGIVAESPLTQFPKIGPINWPKVIANNHGFQTSDTMLESLRRLDALVSVPNCERRSGVRSGCLLEARNLLTWLSFEKPLFLPTRAYLGTHVFRPLETNGGFSLGQFGLVELFVQCSPDDVAIATNLPLVDPVPTLVDFAVWANARWAVLEAAGESVASFDVREAGCLFQMAFGWDEPDHNLRYWVPRDVSYPAWLSNVRAVAREWLEQTTFPPEWLPGTPVFEP